MESRAKLRGSLSSCLTPPCSPEGVHQPEGSVRLAKLFGTRLRGEVAWHLLAHPCTDTVTARVSKDVKKCWVSLPRSLKHQLRSLEK